MNPRSCKRYCGCVVDDRDLKEARRCTLWTVGVVGVITAVVIIILSVKKIDTNEQAVAFYKVSRDVDGPHLSGVRWYAPDVKLYTYTSLYLIYDKTVDCFARDGLPVDLRVQAEYRILPSEITRVFFEVGDQDRLVEYVTPIIDSAVRDACSNFTSKQFYDQRSAVDTHVTNVAIAHVNREGSYVQVDSVRVRNIQLPRRLLDAIEDALDVKEEIAVEQSRRAVALTSETTKFESEKVQAESRVVQAQGEANALLAVANQVVLGTHLKWAQRADAMLRNIQALNVSADEYVVNYLNNNIEARHLTNAQLACRSDCESRAETSCWYCYVRNVTPGVPASA